MASVCFIPYRRNVATELLREFRDTRFNEAAVKAFFIQREVYASEPPVRHTKVLIRIYTTTSKKKSPLLRP